MLEYDAQSYLLSSVYLGMATECIILIYSDETRQRVKSKSKWKKDTFWKGLFSLGKNAIRRESHLHRRTALSWVDELCFGSCGRLDPRFWNLLYALGYQQTFWIRSCLKGIFLVHPNSLVGESTDCHRQAKTKNESICRNHRLQIEEGPSRLGFEGHK